MKGSYQIIIQNKKIKYEFEIRRNITVIRGDSATGKTVLIDMIQEYYENGTDSGVKLQCEKICAVLSGRNWENQLLTITDSIVFIDEGNPFVSSKAFAAAIQNSGNYYVIVTREALETLPYSVTEIFGIRNSGKYGSLKQMYNQFYQIYGQELTGLEIHPNIVITEDSGAGFQFYDAVCQMNQIECISACGKSNIFRLLAAQEVGSVLVIADGAAFGSEIERVMKLVESHKSICLYLPESFEWLILKSGIVKDSDLKMILDNPGAYIESSMYFSWERFFTALLVQKANQSYLKYSKTALNSSYIQPAIMSAVLKVIAIEI